MLSTLKQKTYKLLRYSEKWTGTDMVYLAKGGFWLTGSKIIGMAVSFGLAIAYANLLSQETYGLYKYILSLAGLLGITALTGLDTSLARSIIKGYEGSLKIVIKIKFRWGLIGMAIGFVMSAYYFWNDNNTIGVSMLIAAIFTPLINSLVYSPFLHGKKLFKKLSEYSAINQSVMAAIIICSLLVSPNIILLIFTYFAASFLIQAVLLVVTFKKYKPNDKVDPETIKLGKHLSFMEFLGVGAEQIDKILMWHFLGPAQLAIYSFAIIPMAQIQSILKSISILAFPKLTSQDVAITKKTLPKKILKFMGLLSVIIITYILLSPFFFKIFFPEYIESVKYSWLFSLTLIFFPNRMLTYPIIAQAKHKSLYLISILTPMLKIVLLTLLLPKFGIWGAIAAILISSLIGDSVLYYKFTKL